MTNSPTNSVPSTTTRVNYFTGLARRRRKLNLLPANGDGSTLSLDFTTGVLDPRLTFTRTTNATFINSSGYVQFANANLMTYSNPRQTGTAWGVTGTVTWGSSTLTDPTGGSAAQSITFGTTGSAIFNTSGTTVASGITHTFSVWMRSATGTTTVRIGNANVAPVATVTLTTTWQRFSCQYTTSGTNDGGAIYSQTGTPSAEFYVWGAQVQPGSIVGELIQTSGTINTNTPRFDYDPFTLQPRGLLIEGSANNLCEQGQYCWGTGATKIWVRSAGINVNSVNGSGGANIIARIDGPDGGSLTGTSVVKDAGLSFVRFNVDVTVAASTTYTFSAYVRAPSGGNPYMRLAAFNGGTWLATTGGTTASGITITDTANNGSRFNGVSSTAWVRVWVTFTTQAGQTAATIAFYPDTDTTNTATMYVWGAQVETGSGPSSVVPTGASTGNRAADSCVMTGTNFSSWFTQGEGTIVAQSDNIKVNGRNLLCQISNAGSTYIQLGNKALAGAGESIGYLVSGSIEGYADSNNNPALNTAYKTAYVWSTNYFNVCVNGTLATADTSGNIATSGMTQMVIGADATTPTDSYIKNGHIRSLKYYPTRLANAQLQALTT